MRGAWSSFEIQDTSNGLVCSTQITIAIGPSGYAGNSLYCSAGAVTGTFTALMPMTVGQTAYVAESYYQNTSLNWAFAPAGSNNNIYQKAIF